ncbi:MAG: hypothetical protein B6U78_01385 [Candidatus Aenigmarchaeota archaeon ex4484_224]|nr:MAG: hypothetical protein B6U78_01385 [Candidatus Aenigmarchaeota archaeon ex4484_224]
MEKKKKENFVEISEFQAEEFPNLEEIVEEVIRENPKLILEYRSGIRSSLTKLISKVMERTKGKGDPKKIKDIIIEKL